MRLTLTLLQQAAHGKINQSNATSIIVALDKFGAEFGLLLPHRLAQYVAQLMHESGEFRYDHELWGPTAAQKRYDTRTDLGNTAAADGDGFLYRGRAGIQLTGKANYIAFRDWCREKFPGQNVPDFVKNPDAILTDPWEGLVPIWYWSSRNLNRYADQGDIEMITKRINGGHNGFDARIDYYVRVSLVMLAYGVSNLRQFQSAAGLQADGVAGPKTRAALHQALVKLGRSTGQVTKAEEKDLAKAPVTETVAVAPPQIDKPVTKTTGFWERVTQLIGLGGVGGLAAIFQDWKVILVLVAALMCLTVVGLVFHTRIINAVRDYKQGLADA